MGGLPEGDDLLQRVLKGLQKAKAGSFSLFSEGIKRSEPKHFLPTGITLLDHACGGGLPVGRAVELIGRESTGKTLIGLNLLGQAVPLGWIASFCDTERAPTADFVSRLGHLDPTKVLYDEAHTIEAAFQSITELIDTTRSVAPVAKGGPPIVHLLDSYAGLPVREELAATLTQETAMGRRAYRTRLWFAKEIQRLAEEDVLLIVTNHVTANIGGGKYNAETSPGGSGLRHFCSIRIWYDIIRKIREVGEDPKGVWVRATVIKNRILAPWKKIEFPVYYTDGIHDHESVFEYLNERHLLGTKAGYAEWEGKFHRREVFLEKMLADPEMLQTLRRRARDAFDQAVPDATLPPEVVEGAIEEAV